MFHVHHSHFLVVYLFFFSIFASGYPIDGQPLMGLMPVAASPSSPSSPNRTSDIKSTNTNNSASTFDYHEDNNGGCADSASSSTDGVSSSPGGMSSPVTNGDLREGPVWVVGGFCGHGMPRSFGLAQITARRLLGLPLDELDEDTSKRFDVARLFSD